MVSSPWCSIIPSFMGYLMKQNSPLVFKMSLPSSARGCLLKIMSAWTKVSRSVDKMEARHWQKEIISSRLQEGKVHFLPFYLFHVLVKKKLYGVKKCLFMVTQPLLLCTKVMQD